MMSLLIFKKSQHLRVWGQAKKIVMLYNYPVRNYCNQFSLSPLRGRDLYSTENYERNDFHSLLWIAYDLKHNNEDDLSKLCKGKSVFFVNKSPLTKISLNIAAHRLGVTITSVHENNFDSVANYGKMLSSLADIVFMESSFPESDMQKLADESSVSVINIRSLEFAPVMVLAELLTLYEYYGYLRRVTIAYIGPGDNPMFNTYAVMLPKLGMHLRYFTSGSEIKTETWSIGAKLAARFNTELNEKENWQDAIYRAHTISICPMDEENIIQKLLNKKDIKEMDLKWSILHHDIHKGQCVAQDILNSKQCLVWKSIANLSWILQAIIVAKTTEYKPGCRRPDFEGEP